MVVYSNRSFLKKLPSFLYIKQFVNLYNYVVFFDGERLVNAFFVSKNVLLRLNVVFPILSKVHMCGNLFLFVKECEESFLGARFPLLQLCCGVPGLLVLELSLYDFLVFFLECVSDFVNNLSSCLLFFTQSEVFFRR